MSKRSAANEPISQARTNLDAVLQNLIIKKEESSPYTSDDADGENDYDDDDSRLQSTHGNGAFGDYAASSSHGVSRKVQTQRSSATHLGPTSSGGSSSTRKKRRREDGISGASASAATTSTDHGQFHQSFIVKLFDRSVDLAQFDDSTPLYPICRAWIENQPNSGRRAGQSQAHRQTGAALDSEATCSESLSVDSTWNAATSPDPEAKSLKIPKPLPTPPLQLFADTPAPDSGPRLPAEQLLHEHMDRWKAVRQRWKQAAQSYETRFGRSLDYLKTAL